MATTLSYQVSGPVIPRVDIITPGTYVILGVCEEGADIELQVAAHDIKHDGGGGLDGFEVNNVFLNMIATVRFTLVPYADDYIDAIRRKAHTGSTEGTMVTPGTLYGENAFYMGLYLASGSGDGPWWFRTCRPVRPGSNRISTKETKPMLEFRAINYFAIASFTSINANVLYSRTAPP